MTLYQIYCDGYILDDMRTDDYIVQNPKLAYEKNKVSGLTFIIYKTHPYYDKIKIKRSIIEARKNGKVIYRGRPSQYTQEFDLSMNVDVEGVLSFFNDSIFAPFEFQGSPVTFLEMVIDNHNSQVQPWQQFKIGQVDALDNNDYVPRSSTEYLKSWEVIETRLLNIGGLLRVRYEDDGNYIDWIEGTQEQLNTSPQVIEYGENLIDLKKTNSAVETYTAILPLGAKITEETTDEATDEATETTEGAAKVEKRLTIEAIEDNDSGDIVKKGQWVYSKSAVEKYGWIAAPITSTTWDDVTVDTNLYNKAVDYLCNDAMLITGTLEINAYDLSLTDDEIHSFNFLDYVRVNSAIHGTEETYLLSKLELPYKQPQNTKITVGDTTKTLTDKQLGNKQQASDLIEQIEEVRKNYSTNERVDEIISMQQKNSTAILQDAKEIILEALEEYVETSAYEDLKRTVDAKLSIMADEMRLSFTTTEEGVIDRDGDVVSKFEEMYKCFSFTENGLTIRAGDNEMQITIDNDRIVFSKGGQEFGSWDGVDFKTGNIYIEVEKYARFGNFAAVPRSDGSLSWLKVGG